MAASALLGAGLKSLSFPGAPGARRAPAKGDPHLLLRGLLRLGQEEAPEFRRGRAPSLCPDQARKGGGSWKGTPASCPTCSCCRTSAIWTLFPAGGQREKRSGEIKGARDKSGGAGEGREQPSPAGRRVRGLHRSPRRKPRLAWSGRLRSAFRGGEPEGGERPPLSACRRPGTRYSPRTGRVLRRAEPAFEAAPRS